MSDTDLQTLNNPWNQKYDKGNSGYDRRQIFQGNYIYNLPIFNRSNGLVHSLLGGWQIAGTFVDETGAPGFEQANNTIGAGFSGVNDPVGLGGGYTNCSNIINPIHYRRKVSDWFDTYADGGVSSLAQDPLAPPAPVMLVVPTSVLATQERTTSWALDVSISQLLFTRTLR